MSASQAPTASIQNDTIQRQAKRIAFLEDLEKVRNQYINQLETQLKDINNVAGPAAEEIKLGAPPIRFRGTPQDLIPILIQGKQYYAMICTQEMIEDLNQHLHASRDIDALKKVIGEEIEIAKMAADHVRIDKERWKEDRAERIANAKGSCMLYISFQGGMF